MPPDGTARLFSWQKTAKTAPLRGTPPKEGNHPATLDFTFAIHLFNFFSKLP
jgi:hypothetical protein